MLFFLQRSKNARRGSYTLLGQSQSGSYVNARSMRVLVLAVVVVLAVSFYALPSTYLQSALRESTMDRVLANDDAPPETPMLEETTATPNTHTQETTAIPSSSITHPTLITYVYSESPENRANLEFFLHHGLHAHADFIFIFNGETDAASLLPSHPNINHVARNNTCYDLGAHAEVLTKDSLWKSYSKFILMNASVRGPFLPHWAEACWSDRFLNKLSDTVKLVGTTLNCWPTPHVQSMVWATDALGLSLLLSPPPNGPAHTWMSEITPGETVGFSADQEKYASDPIDLGLNKCFTNRLSAVEAEIGATGIITGAGYKVDVMLERFHSHEDYIGHCKELGSLDVQGPGAYDGIDYSLFETIFIKTNRGLNPRVLELYSAWSDKANYSSWDYC